MGVLALSFGAGALSLLSPCVLPLLPIVIASALQHHRLGPLALAAGLVASSTATGLTFASLGFAVPVDREAARVGAAAAMALAGLALLVPGLAALGAGAMAPVARGADRLARRVPSGLAGQGLLGLLLGGVWLPCTGPTLAAATTLAAQSDNLARAGLVMVVFGVGAAVPLLALAYGSRRAVGARRPWAGAVLSAGKPLMGGALLLVAALTASGGDKVVEAWLLDRMPGWLVDLTVRL